MKLRQIQEAKYAKGKAQFSNLSSEKVIGKFFDEDVEMSKEHAEEYDENDRLFRARFFYAKSGLVVYDDRHGEHMSNVIAKRDGKWITINHEEGTEWEVTPSKFKIYMKTIVYE
ncbi:hypothetical protein LCGC14_1600470 [marine sediment metagenome]|uniref:Uncharacterized protein n=1 Tax=marine sediment metagenome TaxID=412755 RepID=A0A0F9IXT3_9ZZZZ